MNLPNVLCSMRALNSVVGMQTILQILWSLGIVWPTVLSRGSSLKLQRLLHTYIGQCSAKDLTEISRALSVFSFLFPNILPHKFQSLPSPQILTSMKIAGLFVFSSFTAAWKLSSISYCSLCFLSVRDHGPGCLLSLSKDGFPSHPIFCWLVMLIQDYLFFLIAWMNFIHSCNFSLQSWNPRDFSTHPWFFIHYKQFLLPLPEQWKDLTIVWFIKMPQDIVIILF